MNTLIIICGPTAVGKTGLAIQIANHFQTEIISADSRQFFREMNAATAKPTAEELNKAKHHFINSLSIQQQYSAGHFEKDALVCLQSLFEKHQNVLAVGGSGLYIKALAEGMDHFPTIPDSVNNEIKILYQNQGLSFLQEELKNKDPVYYDQVDLSNPYRLIRALSVIRHTGQTFSSFRMGKPVNRNFRVRYIRLDLPRRVLYDKINNRVDTFFDLGWEEECQNLYPFRHLKPLQTVGYTEMFEHIEGKYTLGEAVDKVKQHTRNYAKRQSTWLKKHVGESIFNPSDVDGILHHLSKDIS